MRALQCTVLFRRSLGAAIYTASCPIFEYDCLGWSWCGASKAGTAPSRILLLRKFKTFPRKRAPGWRPWMHYLGMMNDRQTRAETISALQRLTEPAVQGALQSDAELLTLYVESGSRPAIETLIHRYAGMVASVCRCTVSDPSSAEDAFQATFLVLLKSAQKVQNRRSVAAWLHGVAYRTACRLRRQRLANLTEQSPDEVIALNNADLDPIVALARKLELEALDQELEKLPQELREILVEHYLLGYTAPQIAERTALSVSAIEGRIRRGRYALLRQLAKRGISLTVLVAASSWFQQHLQAAEATTWAETFLDSHLSDDASPTDFETNSDILSLVNGEMKMFSASMTKSILSAGATLLVGGLISVSAFSDSGATRTSEAARSRSTADAVGLTLGTLPEETPIVVAQFGAGFGGASGVAGGGEAGSPPANAAGVNMGSQAAAPQGGAGGAPQPAAAAIAEPRQPIRWQVAESEPPAWLQTGGAELEQAERELRELVRGKLRRMISVDFQGVSLRQAMEELEGMTELTILFDAVELANAGVDLDAPIQVSGEMSVREFLRRAFKSLGPADGGLAYTVHESSIEITSQSAANEDPAIRYYDLAYVLPNDSHLNSVIAAIQQTIAPDSWLQAGGTHSISPVGSMLIIACDEPSHQKIEVMLTRIAAINKANLEQESAPQPVKQPAGGMMGGGMF